MLKFNFRQVFIVAGINVQYSFCQDDENFQIKTGSVIIVLYKINNNINIKAFIIECGCLTLKYSTGPKI